MHFDPYSPEFVADPYPTFARLRDESPVFYDENWSLTFFTRHRDVKAIFRDRRFGRDVRHKVDPSEIDAEAFDRIYPPRYPNWVRYIRESFIDFEPPRHTRLRRLVQHAFSKRASESYRPRLEATADRLLDRALDQGRMEGVVDYATPIPLAMIADLMGVPEEDQDKLVEWSNSIVRLYDQACTEEEGRAAEQATVDFVGYVEELIAERRREPGEDLVTALIEAEVDGDRLEDEEIVATSILTLNAGHEATVQAIGNGILALARHPEQYERLRANPGLVKSAAEELLRFDTPLQMFERWVLEDLEWEGTPLKRGTKVGLLMGSANHDEEVFPDAASLDLGRVENDHISFGGGIHLCVGAPLARVELEVAFGKLAERVERFDVEEADLPRVPSLVFRGVRRLPLRIG